MIVGAGLDVERRCAGVGSEEWPAVMGKVEHPHHKYTAFVSSPQRKSLLFLLFLCSTLKCPPRFAAQSRAFRRSSPVFSTGVVPLLNSGDERARKSREEKAKNGLVSPESPHVSAISPRLFRNRSSARRITPPICLPKCPKTRTRRAFPHRRTARTTRTAGGLPQSRRPFPSPSGKFNRIVPPLDVKTLFSLVL